MKLEILKTRISIDHVTITSDDRRELELEFPHKIGKYIFSSVRHLLTSDDTSENMEHSPTKEERKSYKKTLVYMNEENELQILKDRQGRRFYPLLSLKFYSSWENPLTYTDVVEVCNSLTSVLNVPFRLSGYHVAVDLFFDERWDLFDYLAGHTKSVRKYTPELKFRKEGNSGSYYWHSERSAFYMILYNKKEELKNKKKGRGGKTKFDRLSEAAKKGFDGLNVYRFELRFNKAENSGIETLEKLGYESFTGFYPYYIHFLEPNRLTLERRGLDADEFVGMKIAQLQRFLRAMFGNSNNLSYYMREIGFLAQAVRTALGEYRWRKPHENTPIKPPKIKLRYRPVTIIKH